MNAATVQHLAYHDTRGGSGSGEHEGVPLPAPAGWQRGGRLVGEFKKARDSNVENVEVVSRRAVRGLVDNDGPLVDVEH